MNKAKSIAAAILLSFSSLVLADIQLAWTSPTQDVEGNPIAIEEIQGYVLRIERNGILIPDIELDGSTTSYTYVTGKGQYKLSIATRTHMLSSFTEININDECLSYNRSAYNRRTGMKLCGD